MHETDTVDEFPRPRRPFPLGPVILVVVLILCVAAGVYGYRQNQRAEETRRAALEESMREAEAAARNRTGNGGATPDLGASAAVLTALTGGSKAAPIESLKPKLIGVWKSKPGESPVRIIEYRADGTYRDEAGKAKLVGTWTVTEARGQKVLVIERSGGGRSPLRVTFESNELLHDGPEPGQTTVLVRP